ncbi:SigE family RNA polymerase sigma factor [Ornithinimicrobium ciconiae]|uniref:SigE family RNA polymerase sigma factor n=1 Tax=Ornithinimicrobium ciconiae TaxID=2594265 RepID=A0A516GCZ8_9MICO|nr:SigE family RNA polymerase sigma factor [Ornithinimicrobium ciconiae]QDO89382.1 SigE family RNA polymerase sigma factor [Ornithinimicrobium ciconiae]
MSRRNRAGSRAGNAPAPPPGFTEFVMGRSAALFRTAVLLTRDAHSAQDLVQTALTRVWRNWDRIEGEPEAYTRKVILNQFLTDRSRRWTGEHPSEVLPDGPVHDRLGSTPADPAHVVTDRETLTHAIGALPPRQRAVIVLRYYHDLSEAQIAEAMGTGTGTVKSQHSKALAALRISEHLDDAATADASSTTTGRDGS